MGLSIELTEKHAGLGANAPRHRIDVNALHAGKVDDHSAVAQGTAADVVPAAANRHEEAVFAREAHSRDDVGQPGTAGDRAGVFVDAGVPDPARRVVLRVAVADDGATKRADESLQAGGVNRDAGRVDQGVHRHGAPFFNRDKN